MNEIALIYTLFPSAAEACDTCKTLLAEGLVACANRFAPVTSHYMWDGEMQAQEEFPVLFKASPANADAVRDRITELHSYDLPAVLVWTAAADAPYADWVSQQIA